MDIVPWQKREMYRECHGFTNPYGLVPYPHSFSSLLLAITPSPDLEPGFIVTGADSMENVTIAYFQNLYHHTDRAPQQKPWLTSPSVSQIRANTSSDPFQ